MLEAISKARLGDDVYGEDPTARRLEELAAHKLGKEAACLMPSGTMANLASIMAHCSRGSKILVSNESDIFLYEAGGAAVCGGIVYEPLPTQLDGSILIDDLDRSCSNDPNDPQFSPPGLICLENTHNRRGGTVLPMVYLQRVSHFAHSRMLPIHIDGARIFNAAAALSISPAQIAAHADSVQFCLSKGLSAPIGSVMVGSGMFIERVRRIRKMLGGGMRQTGIVAAAGIVALEQMIDRLVEDHANARLLAEGLAKLPGLRIDLDMVQTNIVIFRVVDERFDCQTFTLAAGRRGLRIGRFGHAEIRAVTHSGITAEEVERALNIIVAVLTDGPVPAEQI